MPRFDMEFGAYRLIVKSALRESSQLALMRVPDPIGSDEPIRQISKHVRQRRLSNPVLENQRASVRQQFRGARQKTGPVRVRNVMQHIANHDQLITRAIRSAQFLRTHAQEPHAGARCSAQPSGLIADIDAREGGSWESERNALGHQTSAAAYLQYLGRRVHAAAYRIYESVKVDKGAAVYLGNPPLVTPKSSSY